MNEALLQRARRVRLAVFDVDGVLTDGRLYFLPEGGEFKTFRGRLTVTDREVLRRSPAALVRLFATADRAAADRRQRRRLLRAITGIWKLSPKCKMTNIRLAPDHRALLPVSAPLMTSW